jgi:uncharacterized protein with PIN domain
LNTAPRFVADAMLGRLARWLRVLGYDTSYDTVLDDPELVRRANDEARVLLTRDRRLLRDLRPHQSLEIRHDDPLQQLQSVVQSLGLQPPAELFTRCLLCNTVLDLLPAAEAGRGLAGLGRDLTWPRCWTAPSRQAAPRWRPLNARARQNGYRGGRFFLRNRRNAEQTRSWRDCLLVYKIDIRGSFLLVRFTSVGDPTAPGGP